MKMFMLKAFGLVAVMFVSVLFGMQQANEGINRMKGYEDEAFRGAFTIQEKKDGESGAFLLGNEISSHDLHQKKQKLEEMKAYNFFSDLGKKLSDGVTSITEKSIDMLTEKLKEK